MMKPARSDFTSREWRIIQEHRTPAQAQRFIESIPYNRELDGETCFTFRAVLRRNRAHCLEAALTAAVILEQHGYPPLLVSIESQDKLDHVLLLFKRGGRYGSVARSRDLGLHGRRPVFRTVRDLVMSYYDAYVDKTGRITGYGVSNLNEDLGGYDWRFSTKNVWRVERLLQDMPHRQISSSDARYERLHKRYLEFKRVYPNRYPDFYPQKDWL
jgi:hypothetical protein